MPIPEDVLIGCLLMTSVARLGESGKLDQHTCASRNDRSDIAPTLLFAYWIEGCSSAYWPTLWHHGFLLPSVSYVIMMIWNFLLLRVATLGKLLKSTERVAANSI